jgi:hypothetical protein
MTAVCNHHGFGQGGAMRLPADKVKESILHPDQDVRDAAVFYFSRSYSDDPTLMPLVMEACEQYGRSAFVIYSFLSQLVQTESSVAWLCDQIEAAPTTDDEGDFFLVALASGLRHADPAALQPHESRIERLANLEGDVKEAIAHRLTISSFISDQLWKELTSFCEAQEQEDGTEKDDVDFGFAIADLLARHSDACSERVVEIVRRKGEDWLELLAVRMAGRLRLEVVIPELLDLTDDCETWVFSEALTALAQIGTDRIAEEIAVRYPKSKHGQRMTLADLLEDIHSNVSVQTALVLLQNETDTELRGHLIQSLLMNFSMEGIEPARQHVLKQTKTPELLEVRHDLLVASKMLGVTFPEFDEWLADSQHDVEFRREWYKDSPIVRLADAIAERDDGFDDEEMEDAFDDVPEDTFVRVEARVGRNDPCPCGSGKKYKKCCLGKRVPR